MQQAITLLEQTPAQIPRLQNTVNQTKSGLAVLLGTTPDDVDRQLAGSRQIPVTAPPWPRVFPTICCGAGPMFVWLG